MPSRDILRFMRRPPRALIRLGLALMFGALVSCFDDDFLLGALCAREGDCGPDQCCAGSRCRPDKADHCEQAAESERPYDWAYIACNSDAECLTHGMPRCLVWSSATLGFCTDLCVEEDPLLCVRPTGGTIDRICVMDDSQSLCAIACSSNRFCPTEYTCLDGVCVPTDAP